MQGLQACDHAAGRTCDYTTEQVQMRAADVFAICCRGDWTLDARARARFSTSRPRSLHSARHWMNARTRAMSLRCDSLCLRWGLSAQNRKRIRELRIVSCAGAFVSTALAAP